MTSRIARCLSFYCLSALTLCLSAQPPGPSASPADRHPSLQTLTEGFHQPPPEARLRCYWWWLNGNTTKETITRDLTEMKRKGYGGVLLVDANGANQNGNDSVPAGPEFGSPAWTELYLHALRLADQLGLEVTLNITSGWNLGGPWVQPEQGSKLLTWSRTTVEPGASVTVRLPAPPAKNNFYRQIAVLAYPLHQGSALPGQAGATRKPIANLALKSAAAEGNFSMPDLTSLLTDSSPRKDDQDANINEVIDISSKVDSDGALHWSPPPGSTQSWRCCASATPAPTLEFPLQVVRGKAWPSIILTRRLSIFTGGRASFPCLQLAVPMLARV